MKLQNKEKVLYCLNTTRHSYQIRNFSLQKLFLQFLNTSLCPEIESKLLYRRLKQPYNGYCKVLKVTTFVTLTFNKLFELSSL